MRDLNRANRFAIRSTNLADRYYTIGYAEAWRRMRDGETVYEKVMPTHAYDPKQAARIPWTVAELIEIN